MRDGISDDDRMFEEAMDLVIRLQSDRDNPVAIDMIRSWRARSARHEAVWQEAAEIYGMSGQVLVDERSAHADRSPGLTRRNMMIAGAFCLGAAGTTATVFPDALTRWRADYSTAASEIRRYSLPDGSVATLGPDSALTLGFSARKRRIDLQGMAFFEVASDTERPFTVFANGVRATARGTAYDVSEEDGAVSVSVDHGLVGVESSSMDLGELSAGQWLRFDLQHKALDRGDRSLGQIAAWRQGLIIAEKDRVAAVVERIARWQRGKVVIADRQLASMPISGVFDTNQPVRALEAVVQPYGGKVRQLSPWLTVITRL